MKEINGYRLIEPPLQGGMALVYKGEKGDFKRAFKLVRPDKAANNPRLCERFLREIKVQNFLNHPNIIKILDAYPFIDPEGVTMTVLEMEWLEGMDLQQYVEKEHPKGLDASTVTQIAQKVIDGLKYAHNHNVLHLDVKPSNIFRTDEGYIKIIDFGIARVIGENSDIVEGAEKISTKTETGESTFKGTTAYASPEQQIGAKLSFTSDIYSFGKTLQYLCTGSIDPNLVVTDSLLKNIINKCTAYSPKDRFQSFGEVRDAFCDMVECWNCGQRVSKSASFCPYCGVEITPESETKTCPDCGLVLSDSARFCERCGFGPIESEQSSIIRSVKCPECGNTTYTYSDGIAKYCNHCGIELKKG